MKRKLYAVIAAVMAFSLLAGCAKGNSEDNKKSTGKEKVLIVASTSEPLHYNPNATDSGSGYAPINIFSSLFRMSVSGEIIPDLCEEYNVSEDGQTYTFNLHKDVKWHDGEAFSAEDVKYTLEAILTNKGNNVERLASISEIECPDDNTLILHLSERNAGLINVLSSAWILPKHLYEGTDWLDNPANQNPVGTGPFKFVEHKKGTEVRLAAFDDYFMGRAKIDTLVYKTIPDENTIVQAYLNNEVDVLDLAGAISPAAMPELEKTPNTKISTMISADRQYLITNLAKEPWSNQKVREAVALALDRDDMVKKAHKGYAEKAEGFYTPAVPWAYTDEYKMPERDVEKANQLLDEAGYPADADGIRIKGAEIVIFQFAVFSDMSKIVQTNLKEIGIDTKITSLEYAAWEERLQRSEFDIALIGGYHGPDPDNMTVRIGENGTLNFMKYKNDRIEELFSLGRIAGEEERGGIYKEMQKIMSEELPVMPLTEWCYIVVTRDNVKGHYSELPDTAGSGCYYDIDIE